MSQFPQHSSTSIRPSLDSKTLRKVKKSLQLSSNPKTLSPTEEPQQNFLVVIPKSQRSQHSQHSSPPHHALRYLSKTTVETSSASARSDSSSNDSLLQEHICHQDPSLYKSAENLKSLLELRNLEESKRLDFLVSQIVGRNVLVPSPFGEKVKLYVDYAASGQDVRFITNEMAKIQEFYANTHTDSSYVGAHMHQLLHQAEEIILKECNASPADYFIIDGGAGSTYGIEMTQKILGTYIPPKVKEYFKFLQDNNGKAMDFEGLKDKLREQGVLPLVVVGPYEHHSNEITWRKQLCDVTEIPFRLDGFMDNDALARTLKKYRASRRPIICSFSAGSNVTGIKTDVFQVAKICKDYGALCFFDYAGIGAYVPLDLSQRHENGQLLIDGIYLSPHKYLGGPGSCGLLIMNRAAYDGRLQPTHGGGGTVDYVGPSSEVYSVDFTEREKSGTPGILQIIKCGLAFELKGIMQETIEKAETENNRIFFERMCKNKNFSILGPVDEDARVSIMSFNIWMDGPKGRRFLHHNLVVRLLSDIFGIQGRSGCACAALYGHYLLNIDDENSDKYKFFVESHEELNDAHRILGVKLGWSRVNLHYTLKPYDLEYLIFALEYLCKYGSRFLPLYNFDIASGNWTHVDGDWALPTLKLGSILSEKRSYARDEEARQFLLEKQKEDAMELLKSLPEPNGVDSIDELEGACRFYVEKGNIINRHMIEEKSALFNGLNILSLLCMYPQIVEKITEGK